ncbi:hypothetical protein HK097_005823, partial [Rhizophlyctis rosea]
MINQAVKMHSDAAEADEKSQSSKSSDHPTTTSLTTPLTPLTTTTTTTPIKPPSTPTFSPSLNLSPTPFVVSETASPKSMKTIQLVSLLPTRPLAVARSKVRKEEKRDEIGKKEED